VSTTQINYVRMLLRQEQQETLATILAVERMAATVRATSQRDRSVILSDLEFLLESLSASVGRTVSVCYMLFDGPEPIHPTETGVVTPQAQSDAKT